MSTQVDEQLQEAVGKVHETARRGRPRSRNATDPRARARGDSRAPERLEAYDARWRNELMRFRFLVRPSTLLASMVAATAMLAGAGAGSPITVSLVASELAFAPGADAKVLVRVIADAPEGVSVILSVENGALIGVVAPNLVSPGLAEGVAFVRRETVGVATVRASINGIEVASTVVTFADPIVVGSPDFDLPLPSIQPDPETGPSIPDHDDHGPVDSAVGVVAIQADLKAGRQAAARTWRFEVVDALGTVAVTSVFPLSGNAPSFLKFSDIEPGRYTVRPVLGQDSGYSCTPGKLFEISAPVRVVVPGEAEARFTVSPCAAIAIPASQPTGAAPEGSPEPARIPGRLAPLPPATGNGLTDDGSVPEYVRETVGLTLLITIAVAILFWRMAARSRR